MDLKPGTRWKSSVCEVELVVVRPAKSPLRLECGGHPMTPHADAKPEGLAISEMASEGCLAGKRYQDEASGLEVLCTKGGQGSLSIDGRPLGAREAKKLPASD